MPHGATDRPGRPEKWTGRSVSTARVSGVKSPDTSPADARSGPAATSVIRPMRSDALRNRERLLAAAGQVFEEKGLEASVADVARGGRRRHGHALPPLPLEGGPRRGVGVGRPRDDHRPGPGGGGAARRDRARALPPGVECVSSGAPRLPAQVVDHRSPPRADGTRADRRPPRRRAGARPGAPRPAQHRHLARPVVDPGRARDDGPERTRGVEAASRSADRRHAPERAPSWRSGRSARTRSTGSFPGTRRRRRGRHRAGQ